MPTAIRLLILIVFVSLATSATAQTHRATVRGTITDASEAVIPGAKVTIVNSATNESRDAVSDYDGAYTISSLPPGSYTLTADATGFQPFPQPIQLRVNQDLRLDVKLEVAKVGGHVYEISGRPEELKKDSASIGTVIENRQVAGLPLDGRNFYELSLLVPGAVPAAPGSAGSARGDFSFSVNGAREDSNNFLLDGVYNVDPKLNTFGVRPSVDAIREFEMLTSSYDAAFGRNPGAQVNVVLKSGGNDVHGSLFEFHRNGALDARNFFAPAGESKPKYIRNQFGGSIGGPIKRDRTFFFADYEGTRSREGITRVSNVPTLLERQGDFSQTRDLFGNPVFIRNPFLPRDPMTGQPLFRCDAGDQTGCFAGNQIPDFFQHPVGRTIAALYPAPNRNVPFQNFVSSPTQTDRNNSFDARVDHHLSGQCRVDLSLQLWRSRFV